MFTFPALYTAADQAARNAQREFLWLIRGEYIILLAAALIPFLRPWVSYQDRLVILACLFLAPLFLVAIRTFKRADIDWYRCRALAESLKTLSWRYAMRAEPFNDQQVAGAREDFRKQVKQSLESHRQVQGRIAGLASEVQTISDSMNELRDAALETRRETYLKHRIVDQRRWYTMKAAMNKRSRTLWATLAILLYATAAIVTMYKLRDTTEDLEGIGFEWVLVLASSMLGWVQLRRFNELAAAYSLTAYEIGLIEDKAREADTEEKFSAFVNDAETAFSREHTQWSARQIRT